MVRTEKKSLAWQSKAILLLVVPWTVASVVLQAHWWWLQVPTVAYLTLGISALFGLVVWWMKAGTPAAAATGAAICASLMFTAARYSPRDIWLNGGLLPLLAVFLLTYVATKIGKTKKERLGASEGKRGRNASQVAANLGIAALVAQLMILLFSDALSEEGARHFAFLLAIACLAEAAADTVSSEIGQVYGGNPRMITTFRRVDAGTDGGITVAGTIAGALAAIIVAAIGGWAIQAEESLFGSPVMIGIMAGGGVFGLIFDSLLGATAERKGWLNNDAVNFLSTLAAALFVAATMTCLVSKVAV